MRSGLPAAPNGQQVVLGGARFLRYLDVTPAGAKAPETVYATPTTAGTVIGICSLQGAGAGFLSDCEHVIGSLRLNSARLLGLGPMPALAAGLTSAITRLDAAVGQAGGQLRAARKAKAQAQAADDLAIAYRRAASDVNHLELVPTAARATAALAAALAKLGGSYAALAHAARGGDRKAYDTARTAIASGGNAVAGALREFSRLGYGAG
jgi:hypothetical protein